MLREKKILETTYKKAPVNTKKKKVK